MSHFKINVERLREGPLDLEIHVAPQLLDLTDEEYQFIGPVTGHVGFQIVGNDVLGNGELHARVTGICMRCLGHAEQALNIKVDEIWLKNHPEEPIDREFEADEPMTRSYTGDVIELDEPLRELLMAELPERVICQPECKGLCPGCGVNLNEEACHCSGEVREQRETQRLPDWKSSLKNIRLES